MADGRERTGEHREAARRERERERALRDEAPGASADAADLAPEDEATPGLDHERELDEDGYDEDGPITEEHDAPGPTTESHEVAAGAMTEDEEVAAGTRRMSRGSRVGVAARPRRVPSRPRRASGRARKPHLPKSAHAPHSRAGRVLSLVVLLVAAALIWFLIELLQPFHGSGHGRVTVTIPPNSSSSQVGDLLERQDVIASSFFFGLRATLAGDRGDLRSGTYDLQHDMSYGQVLKVLTTPPRAAKVSNLTIIEGRTRRQIDALLRSQGITGNYLTQTRRSPLLNPRAYGAPRDTPSLEGFLFPSTYQVRDPIHVPSLVADQLRTFKREFSHVNLNYAHSQHLTAYDVLTIASMVQGEAETAHDRPLIASVIYNRLRLGMPLQIDATTRYATGNYTHPLTQSELNSSSPYNTRIRKGLPPTPIDNPGLASIEAAAHPTNSSYLYFVVKPCGNGEQAFASNYKQFLNEAALYNNARTKNGGRSPANC